ncbi:MAG: preprotein translocase subunit SecE [Candidatus Latescibacteria bacterium]|nr:preprotein translocase subunit SecE [Candidatus Latescibacterota bacterium]
MGIFKRLKDYFRNVIAELKKVSWAKRSDLLKTTVVVIILSMVMAAIIMLFDLIFSNMLHLVLR